MENIFLPMTLTILLFDSTQTAFPPNGMLYLAGFDVGSGLKGHFSLGISEQRQSIWDYGSLQ